MLRHSKIVFLICGNHRFPQHLNNIFSASFFGDEARREVDVLDLDLLIPLSLAERRIILVGDHRQLPHLLDPDVERELELSAHDEVENVLRRSLFEKLFRELQALERRDGIKRTATLDVQYRMHPVLGRFISERFYEPHGVTIRSVRGESEFAHNVTLSNGVSLAGKPAAWIELPHARAPEKAGRSKRRPVEARRVAQEAWHILEENPELTLGVITFYAAQREEIFAALSRLGLTERYDDGAYRVLEQWRRTPSGRERLRVGTVDAFQGMEFDVVLLSLTRSNRVTGSSEAARRRRYGFLLLENRLCVAMSRQQRLLVVVGDPAMAEGPAAWEAVPALAAFKQLCEGPHGTIVRD